MKPNLNKSIVNKLTQNLQKEVMKFGFTFKEKFLDHLVYTKNFKYFGKIQIILSNNFDCKIYSVFSRIEKSEIGYKHFMNCNQYSGKYNFHYSNNVTLDMILFNIVNYLENLHKINEKNK